MLNEPHYPSSSSVLLVFGVIFVLILGVFAWAFYFNFGSVQLSAARNFTVDVNGKTHSCVPACEIDLPPNTYDFAARSEGYYDEIFTLDVARWDLISLDLKFQLVPFVRSAASGDIPDAIDTAVVKNIAGKQSLYVTTDGVEKMITDFESLTDPIVRVSPVNALVVDRGRAFFVELESGRRIRRFDDTVQVLDALLSDDGKRSLFFVKTQEREFIWVWDNELNQLSILPWYVDAKYVQWDIDQDHRFFVITNQLSDADQTSFLDQLVQDPTAIKPMGLFLYNLDSTVARQLVVFDEKVPDRIFRRGDRYFMEYAGGEFEELVVE
jgi:hypothetical protein